MDSVLEGDGFRVATQGFSTSAVPFPIGLLSDQNWGGFNSINIDDMLLSIYADPDSYTVENKGAAADANRHDRGEEVLWDIPSDGAAPPMTLEDFLVKAGAFGTEAAIASPVAGVQFDDGMVAESGSVSATSVVAAEDLPPPPPPDKATQRKLRRMRKNRESAARSRERKQAYTMGLESMVSQLEKDNAQLLKEEAELMKERYKQLMENLIPITEKREPSKPSRVLRRMCSM